MKVRRIIIFTLVILILAFNLVNANTVNLENDMIVVVKNKK